MRQDEVKFFKVGKDFFWVLDNYYINLCNPQPSHILSVDDCRELIQEAIFLATQLWRETNVEVTEIKDWWKDTVCKQHSFNVSGRMGKFHKEENVYTIFPKEGEIMERFAVVNISKKKFQLWNIMAEKLGLDRGKEYDITEYPVVKINSSSFQQTQEGKHVAFIQKTLHNDPYHYNSFCVVF
jgi:hypothetical protein